jgi:hypothetical protein
MAGFAPLIRKTQPKEAAVRPPAKRRPPIQPPVKRFPERESAAERETASAARGAGAAHLDPHERDADRMATAALRGGGTGAGELSSPAPAALVPGAGQALPAADRAFFEPRFGRSLADVRVHTDDRAARAASAANAEAYAVGRDIVFGAGRWAPDTAAGRGLLAHELAHTLGAGPAAHTLGAGPAAPVVHRREMPFDPDLIAQQLRVPVAIGDKAVIFAALSGRSAEENNQIAASYLKLTGHTLSDDLVKKLSKSTLTRLGALAPPDPKDTKIDPKALAERSATAVAEQLRDAKGFFGTNDKAVLAALQGRTPAELQAIGEAYRKLTGHDLMAELQKHLGSDNLIRAMGEMGIPPNIMEHNTELGGLSVGNFDFHFKDCKILVWVWVKFKFSSDITGPEQEAFKTRFVSAVHKIWEHSGYSLQGTNGCPCPTVPIQIHVQENPTGFHHKLIDVEKKTDRQRRPHVIRDVNVNLGTSDDTLAHEFGHVLGLYDEYDGGFFENIMFWHKNVPNDPNALMVDAGGTELRPRYFEHYRKRVQQTAPGGCQYRVAAPPPRP